MVRLYRQKVGEQILGTCISIAQYWLGEIQSLVTMRDDMFSTQRQAQFQAKSFVQKCTAFSINQDQTILLFLLEEVSKSLTIEKKKFLINFYEKKDEEEMCEVEIRFYDFSHPPSSFLILSLSKNWQMNYIFKEKNRVRLIRCKMDFFYFSIFFNGHFTVIALFSYVTK